MTDGPTLLRLLVRRLPILLLGVMLGGAAGLAVSLLQTPTYRAHTFIVVVPSTGESAGQEALAINYAQAYGRIATNPAVLGRALARSNVLLSPEAVRRRVSVDASPDAPILDIGTSAATAEEAAELANTVATGLRVYANARSRQTGYQVERFTPAVPPTMPSSPNRLINCALGAALGLLAGGLAVLWMPPRRPLASRRQLARLVEQPVVGRLPLLPALDTRPENGLSHAAVQMALNQLVAGIESASDGPAQGILVVTSPHRRTGTTTVARLLAQALQRRARRVLLVDVRNRRSSTVGGESSGEAVPTDGLPGFLTRKLDEHDLVVVDAGPGLGSQGLVPLTDMVLVVVAADQDPQVAWSILLDPDRLAAYFPRCIGIVINRIRTDFHMQDGAR